uniref:Uncharacterized protein n=1 Tax=Alexandrium monilatum TaxID=311494 RepID=A0A7S4SJN4_9DINO
MCDPSWPMGPGVYHTSAMALGGWGHATVWGKGSGFGKGKGVLQQPEREIPGFDEALSETLMPYVGEDPSGSLEGMKAKVAPKILKAAQKMFNDDRLAQRGTSAQAQVFVEDFVHAAMHAVSSALYERPWIWKANFAGPLLTVVLSCCRGAKIFARTLGPVLERDIEAALFTWKEEERLQTAMKDAIATAGVKEPHRKKAVQHLSKAYDEAHLRAPFGQSVADSPELGHLQDFVRGWMVEFVSRAWDVLEYGLEAGTGRRDAQVLFVTVLFQTLTESGNACLPHGLTSQITTPPPTPWPFIAWCAEAVFTELCGVQEPASKRRR